MMNKVLIEYFKAKQKRTEQLKADRGKNKEVEDRAR